MSHGHLVGNWIHSHEEDWNGNWVFRPIGTSLPPSRGRTTLDLQAGGSARIGRIAETDGIKEVEGEWALRGEFLTLQDIDGGGQNWHVVASEAERMVLKPL